MAQGIAFPLQKIISLTIDLPSQHINDFFRNLDGRYTCNSPTGSGEFSGDADENAAAIRRATTLRTDDPHVGSEEVGAAVKELVDRLQASPKMIPQFGSGVKRGNARFSIIASATEVQAQCEYDEGISRYTNVDADSSKVVYPIGENEKTRPFGHFWTGPIPVNIPTNLVL